MVVAEATITKMTDSTEAAADRSTETPRAWRMKKKRTREILRETSLTEGTGDEERIAAGREGHEEVYPIEEHEVQPEAAERAIRTSTTAASIEKMAQKSTTSQLRIQTSPAILKKKQS